MTSLRGVISGIRVSGEGHRVTTFELLFDLVFVFAFTRVTGLMAEQHTAFGVLQGLIVLLILWWSWVSYAWLANQTHADEGIVRIGMSVAMAAMFVVALCIPEAYDDAEGGLYAPLVLAIGYFIVRLIHLGLYLLAAGDDSELRRQNLKTSVSMFSGSALIITGALLGPPFQTWFWLAGLVVDVLLVYLTSRGGGGWRLPSAAHWAERHGLIIMLALGESIVSVGFGASQLPISWPLIAGSVLAVALTICLWWLYFDVIAIAAERRLADATGAVRVQLATDGYTYLHFPLIAGVMLSALGVEGVIAHIEEGDALGLFSAAALLGGTSLYLVAHVVFWRRVGGVWKIWRMLGCLVLLALIPVATVVTPISALLLTVLVTATLVALETLRYREQRAELRTVED